MAQSDVWSWHGEDKESVVVQSVQAIAVYTNTAGEITIRQQSSMGEDDSFIHIPRSMANAVIKAMRDELKKKHIPE